jgi:hypothetical protein
MRKATMNRPSKRLSSGVFPAALHVALAAALAWLAVAWPGSAEAQSRRGKPEPPQTIEALQLGLDKQIALDAPGAGALQTLADLRRLLRREINADVSTEGVSLRRSIAIGPGVWTPRALLNAASAQAGAAWRAVDGTNIAIASDGSQGSETPTAAAPPATLNASSVAPAAPSAPAEMSAPAVESSKPAAPPATAGESAPRRSTPSEASSRRGGFLETLGSLSTFGSLNTPSDGGGAPESNPAPETPKKNDGPRKPLVIPIIVPLGQRLLGLLEPMFAMKDLPAMIAEAPAASEGDERMVASADAADTRDAAPAPDFAPEPVEMTAEPVAIEESAMLAAAPGAQQNRLEFAPLEQPRYALAAATGLPTQEAAAVVVSTLESAGFVTAQTVSLGGEFGWSVALAEPVSARVEDLLPARDALQGLGFPESMAIDARLMAFAGR